MQTTDAVTQKKTDCINKIKKIVFSIIFLMIFIFLWQYAFRVLGLVEDPIISFYKEPNNSLDIVYVGSSNVLVHFNAMLAYNQYGYTTGLMSTNSQPFGAVKYLIKESEKKQKPLLYVIDIAMLVEDLNSFTTSNIRQTVDSMKFSKNRIDAINELLGYTDTKKEEYINYYLNFLLYHNKWKNINNLSFYNDTQYKGFYFVGATAKIVSQDINWKNSAYELPTENKNILLSLIDYINENNLNVLFVVPIRGFNGEKYYGRLNDAISIIEENGLKVINFNTIDDLEIDSSSDFYNFAHLNVYGSTKFTLYFAKYLKENYNLPDHRNDVVYSSWITEYERFKEDFKKITNKSFDELLLEYKVGEEN